MIRILEGSPGHGKTYGLVKEISDCVRKGIPFATNVPLRDNWPEVLARHNTAFGKWRPRAVAVKAEEYRKLGHVTEDVMEILTQVRFDGEGEGRGRIVLDEFHRKANARVERTDKARLSIIDALSAHRHYGADVTIATQDSKNVDAQIRGLAEFVDITRNMKKTPWIQILIWFNLFIRQSYWNDRAKTKGPSQIYTLSKKIANLYDTHALAKVDWPDNAIILPHGSPCNRPHGPEPEPPPEPPPAVPIRRSRRAGAEVRDSYAVDS